MFAIIGSYQAAALLQCKCWGLANTEKERAKDDPDYTAGALVGIKK